MEDSDQDPDRKCEKEGQIQGVFKDNENNIVQLIAQVIRFDDADSGYQDGEEGENDCWERDCCSYEVGRFVVHR